MPAIILFEDSFVDRMYPVTLSRSACSVLVASWTLAELASHTGFDVEVFVRDYLSTITARSLRVSKEYGQGYPDFSGYMGSGDILFLNASLRPDTRLVAGIKELFTKREAFLALDGERIAAAYVCNQDLVRLEKNCKAHSSLEQGLRDLGLPVAGSGLVPPCMTWPFHLVEAHKELCQASLEYRLTRGGYTEVSARAKGLWVAAGVTLPDLASFKAIDGPVILDTNVEVRDFSCFRGPVYLGPGSKVNEHSLLKDGVCTGQVCKLGGEIECTQIEAYTNKQHHGFLGHSWIGAWVNLGAGSSNSDLKNTYGSIQVVHGNQKIDSGMQFFGCVMGDYSKTAINTSIFTGKIIGTNAMLYGFVGQNVPSFTNWAKSLGQVTELAVSQTVRTQARVFSRRGMQQQPEDVRLLQDMFNLTKRERDFPQGPVAL